MPSTRVSKRIDFDAKYQPSGSSTRGGRLQIINRGTEAAHEVKVTLPERAALSFLSEEPTIPKIPGGGKAVNVTVWHTGRMMGGSSLDDSFDITISARTENGEPFEQEVFVDANEL